MPEFFKGGAVVAVLLRSVVVLALRRRGRCRGGHLRHHPHAVDLARACRARRRRGAGVCVRGGGGAVVAGWWQQ